MNLIRTAFALLALLAYGMPVAQTYPTRPIQLLVPVPPGGTVDFTARVIGPKLSEALGQPVVIENRVGAGGNIAAEFVAKAPPTGHALLIAAGPITINVTLYKKLPFDTRKDLAPVAFIASAPNMLVAGPRMQAASVAELVEYARRNPNKLNFASNAVGSSQHLSAELLKYYGKFSAVHVPYRGLPAAVAAVVTGEVDFMFDAVPTGLPFIRAGKTRALAVASRTRSPQLPQVPTFAELGYDKFETRAWTGLMTTGRTPNAIIGRLEAEMKKILSLPETVAAFEKTGFPISFLGAREFSAFIDEEIERWAVAVKASGATAD